MVVIKDKVIDLITNRAYACKKIRYDLNQIKAMVTEIVNYIDYFNTINEFDSYVFDYQAMDIVMIPNEFVPFIYPRTVKYIPGLRQSTDLLYRQGLPMNFTPVFSEWVDLCVTWRGLFKKDFNSDVSSLASIKVDKALTDVLDKAVYFDMVEEDGTYSIVNDEDNMGELRYETSPYIPIPLIPITADLYRNDYYNSDFEKIVRDYLSTVTFN